jgi:Fibronectin type III domain
MRRCARIMMLFVLTATPSSLVAQGAPAAPTIKTPLTTSDGAVALSWSPSPGATSYTVYWDTTNAVSTASPNSVPVPSGTAQTVSGLTNGTTYYFVVTAKNASGTSLASSSASATPAAAAAVAAKPAASGVQPTTNVGQSPGANVQNPTLTYTNFSLASYPVISVAAGTPTGRLTYLPAGLENLINSACGSPASFNDGSTYAIINVINLQGTPDAQSVGSTNWYVYSKDKTFRKGFANGWQLQDFDGATRLYGAKNVLLVSILLNDVTPSPSPAISYAVTVTKTQPTNVAAVLQLLGLVFPAAGAPGQPSAPNPDYWACSTVPIAYKTSSIKIDISYTAGGGSPYSGSQSFVNEGKEHWDVSFALPVKKASALTYSSTSNVVTASQINKQDLFAVADIYLYPVDLSKSFSYVPSIFGGVAMASQPLHSLLFGVSFGFPLAQVYGGALLLKQQQLNGLSTGGSATPSQVAGATTYTFKPSFSVGIKISIKSAASSLSKSK